MNKKYWLSPIFGGTILAFVAIIYANIASIEKYEHLAVFQMLWKFLIGSLEALPVLLVVFIIISYVASIPLAIITLKIKEKLFLTEGQWWLLVFVLSSIFSACFLLLDHSVRTIVFTIAFPFAMLFNASLFSVLHNSVSYDSFIKKR